MDEDGFFEGELTDGRGGQVLSNVREVSKDDMTTNEPPEPSELWQNADHHVRFCSRSIRNGGKGGGLDKGICVNVLADTLGDTEIPLNHAAVPYPRNLTLIKQFARSIIIGQGPPLVLAVWEEVQNYNINVVSIARM